MKNSFSLKIDGVAVAAPLIGGIKEKDEAIWSKDTGRTASQKMQGTMKAIKKTWTISWPPLSKAEKEQLCGLLNDMAKPFHTVERTEPDGTVSTMECYRATPSYEGPEYWGGDWKYMKFKVEFIER